MTVPSEIFAWLADGEGIVALSSIDGVWAPLVFLDRARAERYRRYVGALSSETGRAIRLVRFHNSEVIAVVEPTREGAS